MKFFDYILCFLISFIPIALVSLIVIVLWITCMSFIVYGDFSSLFNITNWEMLMRLILVGSIIGSFICSIKLKDLL